MSEHDPSSARIERFRQYLQSDPGNLGLLSELCDALLDAGETQAALEVLQPALSQHPEDAGLRYRLGVIQRRLGQFAAALATLSQLRQEGTQAAAVDYELACVHMLLNDAQAGAEVLAQLVQMPDYESVFPDADFLLLRSLHQNEQIEQAIAHGQRVLARGTADARVLGAMATLYIDNAQIDEAGLLLRGVQPQLPADLSPPVRAELESAGGFVALNSDELDRAEMHFQSSLRLDAQFARSLLGLGLVQAASGHLPQAQELLQRTVQAMPEHIGSWHTLAWMQLAQDDIDGAAANFDHALQMDPSFGESQGGMALIAALRGDHAKARELCKLGARLDKNSMNVLAAQLVLQHGSLKSPELLKSALPLLAGRPGLNHASLQATLARFVGRRR